MRPYVVAGNWKMNTTPGHARALAEAIGKSFPGPDTVGDGVQVVVCPPYPMLAEVLEATAGSRVGVGAQNMHTEEFGAYTGEVSAPMLNALGCTHVILGHSERRQYFAEGDELINAKAKLAFAHAITPIVCVGEMLAHRETGATEDVIEKQVRDCLEGLDALQLRGMVLAYEPVWAIGTGKTATPEQAQEVHVFIRKLVASLFDGEAADALVIQYGGSVKPDNARELFAQPDIDGGLIGGASLDADSFLAIVRAAQELATT
ncbi:MAG: triose-phosphate isomerase [Bacteroidota bacterium]|nr:triose-phosphate isomerase [Bacteroidota bacterium]